MFQFKCLLGFLDHRDVAGHQKERLGLSVRADDGADLDIPEARIAGGGVGGALKR